MSVNTARLTATPVNTDTAIITTKITPPRQTQQLIRRGRLLESLLLDPPPSLTLVQAPAGYGKSTLLYQLRLELLERGNHVAWLSLDEDDNDPVTFAEYLLASIDHALMSSGHGERPLPSIQPGTQASIKAETARLLNHLGRIRRNILIVLDDFHLITEARIHAACQAIVEYAPANVQIAVGSRARLPFGISTLLARGQAVEINAEDLRFEVEETEWYLKNSARLTVSPHQIFAIQDITEGWISGLQMTSLALKRKLISDDLINHLQEKNRTVKNFLAEQVLDSQDAPLRHFMLRTSILPFFNVALCGHVLQVDNAERLIRRLEEDNLFLFSLSENDDWYRYHHSFSAFLRSRLERDHAEEIADLHKRAYEWYLQHNFIPEAINHAIEARRHDLANELLARHAMRLLQQGKTTTLLGFTERLSGTGNLDSALVSLAVAWSLILVRKPDEAMPLLEQTRRLADPNDSTLDTRIEVARLTALCWQEQPIEAKSRIHELLASGEVLDAWDYGVLNNNAIYASMFDGELDDAEQAYRRLMSTNQSLYTTVYGKVLLGACLRNKLRFSEAADLFQDALDQAEREAGPQSPAAALAAANLVEIFYEWNDLSTVQSLLEGRLEIIDDTSLNDVLMSVYRPLIRVYANAGSWNEAHAVVGHALRIAREQPYGMRLETSITIEELRLHILQGKLSAAETLADRLARFADSYAHETARWMRERLQSRKLEARAYVAYGRQRHTQALQLIDELQQLAEKRGNALRAFQYRVFRTTVLYEMDQVDEALTLFSELLQIADSQGMIRSLADYGAPCEALVSELRRRVLGSGDKATYGVRRGQLDALTDILTKAERTPPAPESLSKTIDSHAPEPGQIGLSPRQVEILNLIASGLSNKEIAASLFIALDTVKWHLKIIYSELGVRSRTQAIARAKELGML